MPEAQANRAAAPVLAVSGLSAGYGRKEVLREVTFSAARGRICGLFGPNGSGKTTLFRCCLGLLAPRQGSILVDGRELSGLSIAEAAWLMAYVPQEQTVGFPFRVREIVAMGRTPHMGRGLLLDRRGRAVVDRAMDLAGIADLADEPLTSLSGGQRQLSSLARALAQEAPLMLLDEPTSALDFSNQLLVWQALRRVADQGVTVLVCCHDPNHILWFCDDAAVLHQGRLIAAGPSRKALAADVLRKLYGDALEVRVVNGRPLVQPVFG